MKKILVIAPHPDDEVLGCGGTIIKYSQKGDAVFVCYFTKAYGPDWSEQFLEERPKEIEMANQLLNIKKAYFLDFPTLKLDTVPQKELYQALAKVMSEVKPEILLIPHKGDVNKDHRLVFEVSLSAARPTVGSKIKKILAYETLSESEWGQVIEPFIPNVYYDISETIKQKLEAMAAYKSELKPFPHPRSLEAVEALAKKRGSEAGLKFAEAFILVREISP